MEYIANRLLAHHTAGCGSERLASFREASGFHRSAHVGVYLAEPPREVAAVPRAVSFHRLSTLDFSVLSLVRGGDSVAPLESGLFHGQRRSQTRTALRHHHQCAPTPADVWPRHSPPCHPQAVTIGIQTDYGAEGDVGWLVVEVGPCVYPCEVEC